MNMLSSLSRGKDVVLVLVNLMSGIKSQASFTEFTGTNVLLTAIFMSDKERITD
jgi:hypothetical protein